jgi:hypothetical protein
MKRFPTELQRLAEGEASALQITATKCLEVWALLSAAQAEAAERRDDRLSFRLSMIGAAISTAREDETEPA